MDVVETIKMMLAPAVMVNCCGLFLLGMNNKYSVVVGRIRALDDEKRKLLKIDQKSDVDANRLKSINAQTGKLVYRVKLVRNAVVAYTVAVAFFILTCFSIGYGSISTANEFLNRVSMLFFYIGLLCVFVGVYFATREVIKGYEIVRIEVNDFH